VIYPYALYYSPRQEARFRGFVSVQLYDIDAGLSDYLLNFCPGFINKYSYRRDKDRQFGYDRRRFLGRDRTRTFLEKNKPKGVCAKICSCPCVVKVCDTAYFNFCHEIMPGSMFCYCRAYPY